MIYKNNFVYPNFVNTRLMSDEILEIIRESFVQPNVLPPFRADEISEPLMGELVGYGRGYPLNRTIWRDILLNEKWGLPEMDKTSINNTFDVKLKIQDGEYRFSTSTEKKGKKDGKKSNEIQSNCTHKNSSNVLIRTSIN